MLWTKSIDCRIKYLECLLTINTLYFMHKNTFNIVLLTTSQNITTAFNTMVYGV